MEYIFQALLIALVLGLRFRQIDGRASPDCQYYLNVSIGRPTPSPYAYRVLVPWVTKLGLLLTPWKPINIMRALVTVGIVGFLSVAYLLALEVGCSPWKCTAVVLILIMTDSLIGNWIMFPWLADPWAFALAGAACLVDPIAAAVLLVLAAATKEAAWGMGSLAILLFGATWWVPLPGLAVLGLLHLLIRPAPPDTEWLQKPFGYAQNAKRREWFDYKKNLSGMKATPFVAIWVLSAQPIIPAALAGLAWLQTLFAVDHGRLVAACLLWVVPLAVLACPDNLLAGWVLAQTFWPLETEWV